MRPKQFVGTNRVIPLLTLKRTRLFQLLDDHRSKPLTWISGPAGSGKTTLAASYVHNRDFNSFWYCCEEADRDLATFFYHLHNTANSVFESRKNKLPLLQPEYALGVTTFGKNFFHTLFSKIPSPGMLVIDDFHLIPAGSPLHEIIRDSLIELPEGLTVTIVSRQNPPSVFGRLRVESRLAEVPPQDLAFSIAESQALVKLKKKSNVISAEHLDRWHQKTQGWIAGLILLIDRSKKEDSSQFSAQDIATGHIFDYFAGELFDSLDKPIKKFLSTVSLLRVFNSSQAKALSNNAESRKILRDFSSRELFTSQYGRFNPEYQFHPLLREFLQAQLEEMESSETVVELKRKAANILDDAGHWVDAAAIYQDLKDHQALTDLLKNIAPKAIKLGRHNLLRQWISSLPGESLKQEPWLEYWLGTSLVQFEPIEAQPYFEAALNKFLKLDDARGAYLSWAGYADSTIFALHDYSKSKQQLMLFEKVLEKWPRLPGVETKVRVTFSTLNLLIHTCVDRKYIDPWVNKAERILKLIPVRPLRVVLGMELAIHYNITGKVGKNMVLRAIFQKVVANENASPFEKIIAWGALGGSTWTIPDPDYSEGLLAIEKALEIAKECGIRIFDPIISAQAAYICLQSNQMDRAKHYLSNIESSKDNDRLLNRAHTYTLRSHVEAEAGNHATALEYATEAVSIVEKQAPNTMPEFPFRCTLALQLIEMGEHTTAWNHIHRAEQLFSRMRSTIGDFMLECIKARSHWLQNNFDSAAIHIEKALMTARTAGVSGFGHWRPSVMASLLQFALERSIETDYARKLIRLSHLVPDEPPVHIANWPWQVEIHTLGGFKLYTNGELVTFKRKTQKKPIELLKAIVAKGGKDIAIETLMDALWPDSEGDAAKSVFDSTLHRLRKLLINDKVITLRDGHLSLDFRRCWVDTFALERTVESIAKVKSSSDLRKFVDQILELYRGEFLAGEQDSWMWAERERIKNKVIHKIRTIIIYAMDKNDQQGLDEILESILEVFPDSEVFYELLMRNFVEQGRKADAVYSYQRCERILQSSLGVPPSTEMQKLYKIVRNGNS